MKKISLIAVSAVAGLVFGLTGCVAGGGSVREEQNSSSQHDDNGSDESGDGSDESAVEYSYQFDELRVADSSEAHPWAGVGPVEIGLSDELLALLPDGESLVVDSYVVSTRSFPTGICALDVEIAYNEGGDEAAGAELTPAEAQYLDKEEKAQAEQPAIRAAWRLTTGVGDFEVVAAKPADEELADDTAYITEDLSAITVVDECSEDFDDELLELELSTISGVGVGSADVAAMGGSLSVDGQLRDFFDVGVTGSWSLDGQAWDREVADIAAENERLSDPEPTATEAPAE